MPAILCDSRGNANPERKDRNDFRLNSRLVSKISFTPLLFGFLLARRFDSLAGNELAIACFDFARPYPSFCDERRTAFPVATLNRAGESDSVVGHRSGKSKP